MTMMFQQVGRDTENEDMARAGTKPLDAALVDSYVTQLRQTVSDRSAFDDLYARLSTDKSVTVAEMIAIARNFANSTTAKSKKDAILAIGQERSRLTHAQAKAASAGRSKAW